MVVNLPGGELLIQEQEQLIQMLETLRNRKKCVFLNSFVTIFSERENQSTIGTFLTPAIAFIGDILCTKSDGN